MLAWVARRKVTHKGDEVTVSAFEKVWRDRFVRKNVKAEIV